MIKYHPSDEMLLAHAAGETTLGLAIALSAHCEMCCECASKVATMQSRLAQHFLLQADVDDKDWQGMDGLFDAITADDTAQEQQTGARESAAPATQVKGLDFALPGAFRQFMSNTKLASPWSGIGHVSRMRLDTLDGKARSSLLHIAAGGEIPEHTHKGQEITLLLHGHFEDEFGSYGPGDFMLMDPSNQHTPKTRDGCLCYTVVDAPLHFTKGLSKLLNPIGELIY
ncbi:ChrR family anti-sigma-E factor [Shewanella sp.]|uniref:ChrR family anti-sigma-E factor n=1 Tax=Shewanella sp. TaxID=50422 RepID=UPI003563C1BC